MAENMRSDKRYDAGVGSVDSIRGSSPLGDQDHGHGFDMNAWWEDRSLPEKILWGIGFTILGIGLLAFFGWVVMLLWNWLMPDIFGLKRLDYWQSWGLLVLCWILFKNWGMGAGDSSRKTDRKRRQQLRRYMQESRDPAEEDPCRSPKA